ncbi:dapper homolog 3-like isoform X3 [Bufo gargarizans]|uniref:dapper homolog 3-like isoform X3 n=1 Tax=Bufo gargarizans TaxID=30331 RepID=UPI001CF40EB0|nr:dapper homolog 3-like isoform X3 [Bufo gargarizans]
MLGSGGSVDRGRLRQLLRGSVAGLCELKLLRDRQEVRVQRALRGGEDLDRQLWELERQLGELRLRAENDQENAEYEAEGPESCDVFLERAPRGSQAEARMHYASERPKSAGEVTWLWDPITLAPLLLVFWCPAPCLPRTPPPHLLPRRLLLAALRVIFYLCFVVSSEPHTCVLSPPRDPLPPPLCVEWPAPRTPPLTAAPVGSTPHS